jgi:diadenylate cyclase
MEAFFQDLWATLTADVHPIWVVIDILLVYYIFYRVLLLIKGTRAAQMLVGVALIIVAFFASKRLRLDSSHWLLENFTSSFILFLIVIFQHDIRRGLQRVGRRSFLGFLSVTPPDPFLDEVVRSVEELAEHRTGGLIAIERDADLADYMEEGTPIDARVSQELICSILQTSSPIHDGAIILQKGRVAAAGCFLPLTMNPKISRFLGTRHRAGIGLTEETDAVVIIVSEETGSISLALGGELQRNLDAVTLRNQLLDLIGRPKERRGYFSRNARARRESR